MKKYQVGPSRLSYTRANTAWDHSRTFTLYPLADHHQLVIYKGKHCMGPLYDLYTLSSGRPSPTCHIQGQTLHGTNLGPLHSSLWQTITNLPYTRTNTAWDHSRTFTLYHLPSPTCHIQWQTLHGTTLGPLHYII